MKKKDQVKSNKRQVRRKKRKNNRTKTLNMALKLSTNFRLFNSYRPST